PKGLVNTHRDPEGRKTVFESLPPDLPRLISIGRLDINSEGLLLLTNDGGLARTLELPETGWTRRYRVRAHGRVTNEQLTAIEKGVTVDKIRYGPIQATLDKEQGANIWLSVSLQEGKNREVRRVMEHIGLTVNRLIRLAYGPFQLGKLKRGEVKEIPKKALAEQLGSKF
ncbi:MAG: pseudouridine synthase, partial [Rhodospirillales bacterium]